MTTDPPPSCETCTKHHKDTCPKTYENCHGNSDKFAGMDLQVRDCGCLFHPLSRSWLNRDVIRELEARKSNCDEVKARLPITSESYGQLKIASSALSAAIALLKGGDGK